VRLLQLRSAGDHRVERPISRPNQECAIISLLQSSQSAPQRPEAAPLQRQTPAAPQVASPAPRHRYEHADDYSWIVWDDVKYDLAKGNQAESIRALWESWERSGKRNGAGLSEKTIGEKCGSSANDFRLAHAFRDHPVFGTVIRSVSKGTFALFAAESPENPTC
jgi:hypothetical protein